MVPYYIGLSIWTVMIPEAVVVKEDDGSIFY
jgi:hypothetical protein